MKGEAITGAEVMVKVGLVITALKNQRSKLRLRKIE